MKTLRKIKVAPEWVETVPDVLEDGKIYISLKYNVAIHLCLCGCGNESVMPLGEKGWVLKEDFGMNENEDASIVSFTPSVLNQNCPNKYHYIITRNIANVV